MSRREKETTDALATVLTAQDRKKEILERRRQSLQRSHSMPISHMGSSPSKRSRLESFSRRSFSPSAKSLLFADDSRINSRYSTGQTANSNSDDVSETNLIDASTSETRETRNSTLFGLVMQHSQNTPKRNRKGFEGPPTTPTQRVERQLASPGGFGLVKMLSSVTSPFAGKSRVSPVKKVRSDNWEEAPLDQILDWTIKSKVRLECYPPACLPCCTFEGLQNWNRALQYWQYPVEDSVASTEKLDSAPESTKVNASDTAASPSHLAQRLVNAVRGSNAYIHKLVRSEDDLAPLRARRRWQDAFQSVYHQWLDKIEDGDATAYFYATTSKQVILFRSKAARNEVLPMIAFSCSTREFRSKLQARGVKMYILRGSTGLETFHDSLRDPKPNGLSKELDEVDGNPQAESLVNTDLEALRKAQVYGETAGADVTVKAPSKRRQNGQAPALFVMGYDDCAAVSTVLLNHVHDVANEPLIMSRLGPFQNGILKSLVVSKQRTGTENAFVDLLGPILPCMMPSLAKAAASVMRHHAANGSPMRDTDSGLGTHYFVLQAIQRSSSEESRDLKCGLLVDLNGSGGGVHHSTDVCVDMERVDVVVWDIARPSIVTYKVETA